MSFYFFGRFSFWNLRKKSPVSRDIGEINCAALFLRFASHLPAVAAGFGTFPPLSGRLSDFFGPVPSVTLDKMFFCYFFYYVILFFYFFVLLFLHNIIQAHAHIVNAHYSQRNFSVS